MKLCSFHHQPTFSFRSGSFPQTAETSSFNKVACCRKLGKWLIAAAVKNPQSALTAHLLLRKNALCTCSCKTKLPMSWWKCHRHQAQAVQNLHFHQKKKKKRSSKDVTCGKDSANIVKDSTSQHKLMSHSLILSLHSSLPKVSALFTS